MKQTVRYETVFTSVYLVQGVSSFVPVYQKVFHVEFIISHGLALLLTLAACPCKQSLSPFLLSHSDLT